MARFFKDFPQKCGKRRDRKCLRRKGLRRHGKNGAPILSRWRRLRRSAGPATPSRQHLTGIKVLNGWHTRILAIPHARVA